MVFVSKVGTELLAGSVRRALRIIPKRAGLAPEEWTPRELLHSFASLMSPLGVSVEEITDLVGHRACRLVRPCWWEALRPIASISARFVCVLRVHRRR
jgi:site-specific recombinase XerD